jgi:hypothetical protein
MSNEVEEDVEEELLTAGKIKINLTVSKKKNLTKKTLLESKKESRIKVRINKELQIDLRQEIVIKAIAMAADGVTVVQAEAAKEEAVDEEAIKFIRVHTIIIVNKLTRNRKNKAIKPKIIMANNKTQIRSQGDNEIKKSILRNARMVTKNLNVRLMILLTKPKLANTSMLFKTQMKLFNKEASGVVSLNQ